MLAKSKATGVTCHAGNVQLLFSEAPDLVGVMVTLVVGERAVTAHLTPEAWERLTDRYGGPFSEVECKAEPDLVDAATVEAMKAEIEQLKSSVRYAGERTSKLAEERDAAKKLAEERAPSFGEFVDLKAAVKVAEDDVRTVRALLIIRDRVIEDRERTIAELERDRTPSTVAAGGARAYALGEAP